jgi:hypothetical protein
MSVLRSGTLLTALLWAFSSPSAAQQAEPELCSADWVVRQAWQAQQSGETFLLFQGGSFEERGAAYVVAVMIPFANRGSTGTLQVYASEDDRFTKVYEEEVATLAPTMAPLPSAGDCRVPGFAPWLSATVVDLDADGAREIVIESNGSGTCDGCLSEVRVLQVSGSTVEKVVETTFNAVRFGLGEGLTVSSYRRGIAGRVIPVLERFFVLRENPN